jgi:hypothetical protein
VIEDNLFVGPANPAGHVVDWSAPINDGTFDYDGYFPDGFYDFNAIGKYPSFAAMQAGGVLEPHGTLLNATTFANGLTPPASYKTLVVPPDASLSAASNAVDVGIALPNVDDGFTGTAPDLGALERGCPIPIYGVRPGGIDETNEPTGCGGPANPVGPAPVLIGTYMLTLSDPASSPAKRKIRFSAATKRAPALQRVAPPAPGSGGDPTQFGATLTIYNAAASGEKFVVLLPNTGWKQTSKGFQYTGAKGSAIMKVVVTTDMIMITGGGASWGYTLTAPSQGSVAVQLALGTGVPWCTSAPARLTGHPPSSVASDHPGTFVAAPKSPAPVSCATIP